MRPLYAAREAAVFRHRPTPARLRLPQTATRRESQSFVPWLNARLEIGDQLRGASIVAIPTEPIGSIARPPVLVEAARAFRSGRISEAELLLHYDSAVQDTIARFEATGSKVVTDGEQAKESFATYPIQGLTNIASDGTPI